MLDHIFVKRYLSILQTPFSLKHGPVSGAYHSRAGRGGPTIAFIRTSSDEVHGVSEMIAHKFPCRRQPSRDCEDCDRSASRCTHLPYPHIRARGSFSKNDSASDVSGEVEHQLTDTTIKDSLRPRKLQCCKGSCQAIHYQRFLAEKRGLAASARSKSATVAKNHSSFSM